MSPATDETVHDLCISARIIASLSRKRPKAAFSAVSYSKQTESSSVRFLNQYGKQ